MTPGFKDYLREAFNAKPWGMFVAPNWVGLGALALLGLINPGFWLLGAGLELGYLYALIGSQRFRRYVNSLGAGDAQRAWQAKIAERVARLSGADVERFRSLEERCRAVLARQQGSEIIPELPVQAEGLGRLLWIYLGLLQTRQTLRQLTDEAGESAADKLRRLEAQLRSVDDEHLSKSLAGQIDILRQRVATQNEGRAKVEFLEAELARIEEQVELIREQSLVAADPASVSRRIDEVGATLGGTTQWIREQNKIYGEVAEILDEAPPMPLQQSQ
ncbi:MAG: hypothetical protein QOE70_1207 [Chthoniobacter sp.]|jgi:hypothetical protein|nr:hypothetical protein [Chthoniobacter sp.]